MTKRRKITMTVLIILLALNLICDLIFELWVLGLTIDWAWSITNNPVADMIWYVHNNFFATVACFLISFVNLFYSIVCLRSAYKEKTSTFKGIVGFWIYLIISLGSVYSSCKVFWTIFMTVIAG